MIQVTVGSESATIQGTAGFVYAMIPGTVESEFAMTRVTVAFVNATMSGTDQCARDRSRLTLGMGHDGDTPSNDRCLRFLGEIYI